MFSAVTLLGCQMDLHLVWSLCDTLNGCMAIPNLCALFGLSGEVAQETRGYLQKRKPT